jgi:hypothetical protein
MRLGHRFAHTHRAARMPFVVPRLRRKAPTLPMRIEAYS